MMVYRFLTIALVIAASSAGTTFDRTLAEVTNNGPLSLETNSAQAPIPAALQRKVGASVNPNVAERLEKTDAAVQDEDAGEERKNDTIGEAEYENLAKLLEDYKTGRDEGTNDVAGKREKRAANGGQKRRKNEKGKKGNKGKKQQKKGGQKKGRKGRKQNQG